MSFSRIISVFALACLDAAAQDKPNLSGSWKLKEAAKPGAAVTLLIEQKGKEFHIVRTVTGVSGKEQKADFKCSTDGKECESAGSKISMWFDGASLVEMDAGESVSKIILKLDGEALKMELTHIFPEAEPETFVLVKI